ncbi:MAG: O-antigen ligase family protein [Natronospirillum sp.]
MSDQIKKALATAGVFFNPMLNVPALMGLLLLSPLLLPFVRLPTEVPMYDQLRIAVVVVIIVAGYISLVFYPIRARASMGALSLLLAAVGFLVGFGFTDDSNVLEISLALTLLWFIAPLLPFAQKNIFHQAVSVLLLLFALSLFVAALFAWLPFCVFEYRCRSLQSSYVGFENKRLLNDVQNLLVPVLLGVWLVATRQVVRRLALMAFGGMLWLGFLLDSRGLMLSLSIVAILVCIVERPRLRTLVPPVIMGTLALLSWWSVQAIVAVGTSTTAASIRTGDSGRFELWTYSIERILAAPWTGYGPGAFATEGNFVSSPHNILLTVGYDYGVLVALLVAVVMVGLFWSILTFRRTPLAASIAWGLLVLMIASLVSSPHITPLGQLFYVIAVAVTLATDERLSRWWYRHAAKEVTGMRTFRTSGVVLWSVVCGALIWSMLATYPAAYDEPKRHKPRVWLDGEYSSNAVAPELFSR